MGKEMCKNLLPSTDLGEICLGQMETSDALSRIYAKGSLSFSGLRSIRDSLLRLKVGSSLSAAELMHIASLLETALRAKSYGRRELSLIPIQMCIRDRLWSYLSLLY